MSPWLIAALCALLALAAWAWARAAAARERALAERAREKADHERIGRAEAEANLEDARAELARSDASRRAVREWARRMGDEVSRLHHSRGALSDPKDTPGLVLQVAINLLEAEKGMLLSRVDADGDGKLDLVRAQGFETDPEDSALAQALAERVIERDRTLRRTDLPSVDPATCTAADEEIDDLVAIPIYLRDDFHGVLVAANRPGGFADCDEDVLLTLGDHAGSVLHNANLRGELRTAYLNTVATLADAVSAKDPELGGHSEQVAGYVAAVAERLGVDPAERESLLFGSLLHDVGKIGISEQILLKPAALTPEERTIIELHPRIGYRFVSRIPALELVALAVLHHHERYDGEGYPSRLRGEQIPLHARIVGVADSFSAMVTDRPYRNAMGAEEACAELERCAGTQFDPAVVEAFVTEVRRHPPDLSRDSALADPELEIHRQPGVPLIGASLAGLVDPLTGLSTRRHIEEVGDAELQRSRIQGHPVSCILIEFSGLADVNRVDGAAVGDVLLQESARALHRAAVQVKGTASRCAGRRLALLVPDVDEAGVRELATQLRDELPARGGLRVACVTAHDGERTADLLERGRAELGAERVA